MAALWYHSWYCSVSVGLLQNLTGTWSLYPSSAECSGCIIRVKYCVNTCTAHAETTVTKPKSRNQRNETLVKISMGETSVILHLCDIVSYSVWDVGFIISPSTKLKYRNVKVRIAVVACYSNSRIGKGCAADNITIARL